MRIELTTYALRVRCSTPELPGRVFVQDNLPVLLGFSLSSTGVRMDRLANRSILCGVPSIERMIH